MVVDAFFDEMANALAKGGSVEIRGPCSFYAKKYKAYTCRNPKTGESNLLKFRTPVQQQGWTSGEAG